MADAKAKIGAKIALDGEREYKQAIKDISFAKRDETGRKPVCGQ